MCRRGEVPRGGFARQTGLSLTYATRRDERYFPTGLPCATIAQEEASMKGVQFVVDEAGKQTAVLIDLGELGDAWEDFYEGLIAESRKDDEKIKWEDFDAEMGEG